MKRRLGVALGGIGLVILVILSVTTAAAAVGQASAVKASAAAEDDTTTEQAGVSPAQVAAEEYLKARSQAVLPESAAPDLTDVLARNGGILARERLVAKGKVVCWQSFDERPVSVRTSVVVRAVDVDETAGSASVQAYVYTTVTLRGEAGGQRQEGEGIDHPLTLACTAGRWQVVEDQDLDTAQPSYLCAAGASAACVRRAAQKLAHAADGRRLGTAISPVLPGTPATSSTPAAASGRVITTLTYDRADVVRYADKWTSESDSTGVSHNGARYNPAYYDYASNGGPGDCTPYASQCIRAGGYPFLAGWYYDFSNPFKASSSWYNNNPQRTYLKGRYFDRVDSVSDLSKGDIIYYDWNADGYLDHTAVYVGIYDGVRCIDAHTSDHRHHSWKLGGSSTKYYFFNMRDTIRWPLADQ